MNSTSPELARKARGFTLMEIMIAVSLVAVLAVIIIPGYTAQVQKSRRADAKTALVDLAAREERFYAYQNRYSNTASELGYASLPAAVSSSGVNSYSLSVALVGTGFTGTATRVSPGPQANDVCGDYTLDDKGAQANVNNSQTSPPCW